MIPLQVAVSLVQCSDAAHAAVVGNCVAMADEHLDDADAGVAAQPLLPEWSAPAPAPASHHEEGTQWAQFEAVRFPGTPPEPTALRIELRSDSRCLGIC